MCVCNFKFVYDIIFCGDKFRFLLNFTICKGYEKLILKGQVIPCVLGINVREIFCDFYFKTMSNIFIQLLGYCVIIL